MERVPAKSRAKSIPGVPGVAGDVGVGWSDSSAPTLPKWIAIALVIAVGDWRESRALRHTVSLALVVIWLTLTAVLHWWSSMILAPVFAGSYFYVHWRATRGNFRRPFERRAD